MNSFKQSKLKMNETKLSNLKLVRRSRKQIRKEHRLQKKISKAVYLKKRNELRTYGGSKKIVEVNDNKVNRDDVQKKEMKEKEFKKFECKRKSKKNELLKQANLKEDRVIKRLEKQLKLNKRKKKTIPRSFVTDGLDYLLNFCFEEDRKYINESKKELLGNEINSECNIALLETMEANTCISGSSCNIYNNENEKKNENINKNKARNGNNKLTVSVKQFNVNNNIDKLSKIQVSKIKQTKSMQIERNNHTCNKDSWEDIYGRKRDKEGNVIDDINKYIIPATQTVPIQNISEKLYSLRKQLKGCLNKLTEHNIHSISNQIETMYMTNSRNNMNCVLSELMFESLVSHVITPVRLISEHMMLIAILHANIGIEIGANFLEKLIQKLVETMEKLQEVENKELDNVVLIISHLYNFKIFGYKLLYQILNKLMIKFTEKEIELILLILKTVGFSLRKDDPNALKEFIQNLQQKASHESEEKLRVKFMLEILLAIKNNNVNKIPQYDAFHVEHLKKVMKSVIRKGNTITQLNVSLEDLLQAEKNGKWWIIGSAWSGSTNINNKANTKPCNKINFDKKVLELAQNQRMNTDTRKNIFCILMTAEDYLDAFEKLHHLGLKDQQQGEIIHVLMHCCLQENKFNPYYAILAQKLCEYNRKYQLTIQYNLWDKLKSLESYESKQLSNLAQFLTHLFIEKCLALSILKIIQFTELDRHTMQFLREIILGILLHENELVCVQVFERISVSPQLQTFRESLRLFINCFLIKQINACNISNKQKIMLKKRVELIDKILILHGSKILF